MWRRIKYFFTGYKAQNFYHSLIKKAPKCILAIVLLLSAFYILIHPLDRIKLKYFLTHDFTITVSRRPVAPITNTFVVSDKEIFIDDNWMQVGETDYLFHDDVTYYEFKDGKTYRYYKDMYGEWQKETCELSSIKDINDIFDSELLDRKNYKRVKGKLFVWQLKDGSSKIISGHSVSNIRLRRYEGSIAIVGDTYSGGQKCELVVRFHGFGFTDVTLPWDGLPS